MKVYKWNFWFHDFLWKNSFLKPGKSLYAIQQQETEMNQKLVKLTVWCCCCCFLCNWNSRELVTGSCGGCGGGWFLGGGGGGARCPPFLVLLGLWSAGHAPPPPLPLPPRMQWLGEPLLGHKGVNSIELEEEAMHTSNACTSEWPITYYSQNVN